MHLFRARLFALALAPLWLLVLEVALRSAGFVYAPLEIPIVVPIETRMRQLNRRLAEEVDNLPANANEEGMGGSLHRPDDEHFWLPREGAPIPWTVDERITPGGYRGADPDPNAPIQLVLLGDSSSFGWGLSLEETAARRLERALEELLVRERGPAPSGRWVQVLNAGVIGSSSVQGLARYRGLPSDYRPHVVIEAFGAINDQFTVDLDDRRKLARHTSLSETGFRSLREHVRVLHAASYLLDLRQGGRQEILAERARAWRHGRRSGANEALAAIGVQNRPGPTLEEDYEALRVSPEEFGAALEELHSLVRADDAELVCLAMPRARSCEARYPRTRDYDPVVRAFAERHDLACVEAGLAFRAAEDAGTPLTELFQDTIHPSAAGAERLADMLFEAVAPIVRELAPVERKLASAEHKLGSVERKLAFAR